MRRKTFDAILATGGLVVAVVLAIAGGLGMWAHSFVNNQVHTQLAQEQIYFPDKAGIAAQHNADITKYVTPYAGQQVVTGAQAEVFANHYIANHLKEVAGGQTYSQVSEKFLEMKPTDPNYATVSGERQTLFMGETLRGLLLNAYAFGTMGTIAGIAAIVAFASAAVMLALSALGFRHLRRTPADAEVFTHLAGAPKEPALA
jgi:hypothetical protein